MMKLWHDLGATSLSLSLQSSLTKMAPTVSARPSKPTISVKQETPSLAASEIERIKNDAKLSHLIKE